MHTRVVYRQVLTKVQSSHLTYPGGHQVSKLLPPEFVDRHVARFGTPTAVLTETANAGGRTEARKHRRGDRLSHTARVRRTSQVPDG